MLEGIDVGLLLGVTVGTSVGECDTVGLKLGVAVGNRDGTADGVGEGFIVGGEVGECVGFNEAWIVGLDEGRFVGFPVGLAEGKSHAELNESHSPLERKIPSQNVLLSISSLRHALFSPPSQASLLESLTAGPSPISTVF